MIRSDTLQSDHDEGSGYVYWMRKGVSGRQSWVARMYSTDYTKIYKNGIYYDQNKLSDGCVKYANTYEHLEA